MIWRGKLDERGCLYNRGVVEIIILKWICYEIGWCIVIWTTPTEDVKQHLTLANKVTNFTSWGGISLIKRSLLWGINYYRLWTIKMAETLLTPSRSKAFHRVSLRTKRRAELLIRPVLRFDYKKTVLPINKFKHKIGYFFDRKSVCGLDWHKT